MNIPPELPENTVHLPSKQISRLERIAMENKTTPAHLVELAVDALLAEAARHEGWQPIPNPSSTKVDDFELRGHKS